MNSWKQTVVELEDIRDRLNDLLKKVPQTEPRYNLVAAHMYMTEALQLAKSFDRRSNHGTEQ